MFLYISLLLFLPILANQTPLEIFENWPTLLNQSLNEENSFIFQVTRPISSYSCPPVIIYANPQSSPPSSIEIYISTTPINLTSKEYQIKCVKILEMNPCVFEFSDEDVSDVSLITLYFTVKCFSNKCNSLLKIYHILPVYIPYETPELFKYNRDQGEIFNFTIPKAEDFDRLVFTVSFKNDDYSIIGFHNTNVFFSQGKPRILISMRLYMAVFESNDKSLCFDCNITVFLTSQAGNIIELQVYKYKNTSNLTINHEYYDMVVSTASLQTYRLNINESNSDYTLIFSLRSISGAVKTLLVHPDDLPNKKDLFLYNSMKLDKDDIWENDVEVSKNELNALKLQGSTFYIAVESNITGAYILYVELRKDIAGKIFSLRPGITESGVLMSNETRYYSLEIYRSDKIEGKFESLLTKSAGDLNLYIKLCNESKTNCSFTFDAKPLVGINDVIHVSDKPGDDIWFFTPQCPDDAYKCYYLFKLQSNSMRNSYRFLIRRMNSVVNLLENVRHESHITLGAKQVYSLNIFDNIIDIEMISFEITGDLDFIIYQNVSCIYKNDNCTSKAGNSKNPVQLTNESYYPFDNLDGVFYILILGSKSTSFQLFPLVQRKTSFKYRLIEGMLFRGVINKEKPEIELFYKNDYREPIDIIISLQSKSDYIKAYITDEDKESTDYKWIGDNKDLIEFIQYPIENGNRYKIFIRAKDINELNRGINIDFSIIVSTNKTLKILEKNTLFMDKIQANHNHSLIFMPSFEEARLIFTIDILNTEVRTKGFGVFIGQDPDPSSLSSNLSELIINKEVDSLIINHTLLSDLCNKWLDESHCKLFISLANYEAYPLIYTISLTVNDYAIELPQAFEKKIPLSSTGDQLKLYYHIMNRDQALDISLKCYYPPIIAYITLYNNKNLDFRPSKTRFPDNGYYEFLSTVAKTHYIHINEHYIEKCWPHCIVLLSLFNSSAYKQEIQANVWVIVASDSNMIIPGKAVIFSLEAGKYKYFYMDLSGLLNPIKRNKTTIFISLTKYVGDGGLYIKLNDDTIQRKPFPNDFDYYSSEGQLSLKLKDLDYLKKLEETQHPKLAISVFCSSKDCEFSLNIRVSNNLFPNIMAGYPQDIEIINMPTDGGNSSKDPEDKIRYFIYKNGGLTNLKVKFLRETGIGRINIVFSESALEYEKSNKTKIDNNGEYSAFFASSGESHILLNINTPGFCQFCDILIIITAFGDLKGSLLVLDSEEFAILQEGKQYIDSINTNEMNKYRIYSVKDRETIIKLHVFSGNPGLYYNDFYETDPIKYKYHINKDSSNDSYITLRLPADDLNSKSIDVHKLRYLIVTSKEPSNYSLIYSTGQIFETLTYGVLSSETLSNNENKTFIFHTIDPTIDKHLTLMINEGFVENLMISFLYKNANSSDFVSKPLKESLFTNKSYIFMIPKEASGIWRIDIININSFKVKFSLILNSLDAILLPMNTSMQNLMTSYKSWKYYEVYIPSKGYLLLYTLLCAGDIEIGYTKEYTNLFLHNWEGSLNEFHRKGVNQILKVDMGMYYIGIQSKEKGEDAIFEIYVSFTENYHDLPQNNLFIGNEGVFEIERSNEDRKEGIFSGHLRYKTIKCGDFCGRDEMMDAYVVYELLFSNSLKELNVEGKCQVQYHDRSSYYKTIFLKNETLFESNEKSGVFDSYEIKGLKPWGVELAFTIKATVYNFKGNNNALELYYQDIEFDIENKKKNPNLIESFYFFIGCMGALIVIICGICCLKYWKKYLKV